MGSAFALLDFLETGFWILSGLTAAALAILLLGMEEGFFHGYYLAFPLVLEMMVLLFSVPLGTGGCPVALTFGVRRKTLFWTVQMCGAVLGVLCLLLCGTVEALSALLGRSCPNFCPLDCLPTVLYYLAACFLMTVLGAVGGLLMSRFRRLGAWMIVPLYLLSVFVAIGQVLVDSDWGTIWRTAPWPVPVGMGLLLALGEALLWKMLSRLAVR